MTASPCGLANFKHKNTSKKTIFLRSASQANLLCSGVTSATSFPRGVPSGLHICAGVGGTSAGGCILLVFEWFLNGFDSGF